jgi:hypothetical protein
LDAADEVVVAALQADPGAARGFAAGFGAAQGGGAVGVEARWVLPLLAVDDGVERRWRWLRMSANSRGLAFSPAAKARRVPSVTCQTPGLVAGHGGGGVGRGGRV